LIEPVMVHWEMFPTRTEAVQRERYFKGGSGHRVKREIIASGLKLFSLEREAFGRLKKD
jgi:predicted GIY-YIG superfamily endonuclease